MRNVQLSERDGFFIVSYVQEPDPDSLGSAYECLARFDSAAERKYYIDTTELREKLSRAINEAEYQKRQVEKLREEMQRPFWRRWFQREERWSD